MAEKVEERTKPEAKSNPTTEPQSEEGQLKLFVGGLYFQSESIPYNLATFIEDLTEYFQKIAPIVSHTLMKDKSSTRSRGFAFITLEDKGKL